MTPLYSMKIFAVKIFANCPETAKFAKVFIREKFPLYCIIAVVVSRMDSPTFWTPQSNFDSSRPVAIGLLGPILTGRE